MLSIIAEILVLISLMTHAPYIQDPNDIHDVPVPMSKYAMEYEPQRTTYPACGIVYGLEYADDAVIVMTPDGELWEFYGCEDWAIGDICAMTFADAGIPNYIWDDEIIDVRYVGYIGE